MREIDGLPVYKITIDKEYSENGEDLGVDQIAFTSNPAIQVKGFAFENQEPKKLFFKDEVKMRIAAPSMIPMDIYRKDEDGTEYYVEFTAEVIEEIHSKMMSNLKTKDLFNLEHDTEKKVPAYVHEILLVDSEAKQKYIKDEYDIDTKLGSQFVVSQITDEDYYNSLVENEQFAYSIEGFLGLKLNKHDKMAKSKLSQKNRKGFSLNDSELAVEIKEEVAEIIDNLTPEEVPTEEAEAIAETVVETVVEVIAEMPTEVQAKLKMKKKKYGKAKLSEEDAAAIEEAEKEIIAEVTQVIDAETPTEVTPELSEAIATVVTEAVQDIVAESPEEVTEQLLNSDKKEEEKEKMNEEEEEEMNEEDKEKMNEEEEEEMSVDPALDSEAIMTVVQPALDALRTEILDALAEKQNEEEEVVEEEVEMQETKLSITERFAQVLHAYKDVNY